jgi:prepilin-type processing-associated H-X9-DG protein
MRNRLGLTLPELLVVNGILAVLLAVLIPAVLKVRESALRARSSNNLRQISVALQHYASQNADAVPCFDDGQGKSTRGLCVFGAILPYLERNIHPSNNGTGGSAVNLFISPADPTASQSSANDVLGLASYAANWRAFQQSSRFGISFSDGTSNTIAFAEHYAECGGNMFMAVLSQVMIGDKPHRATFADLGDYAPITTGDPPTSKSLARGLTFQSAPRMSDCNPALAQTPHPGGMIVALLDGSVRFLSPRISDTTYWGAITPSSREVLGMDW